MTSTETDAEGGRLKRARGQEIALSEADLAELLEAAFQSPVKNGDRPAGPDAGRLAQVAAALGLPGRLENAMPSSAEGRGSQQSLLELRLLRAFCELRDPRAQRMLVYLAEQLATCAGRSPRDAG